MVTDRQDILRGTLGLIVLKTLDALGPLHGYRRARRRTSRVTIDISGVF
jgi:hypothetical protein